MDYYKNFDYGSLQKFWIYRHIIIDGYIFINNFR